MWKDDKGTLWGNRNEWIRLGKRDGKAGRVVQYPMNPAYLVGYQTGVRYANTVREMAVMGLDPEKIRRTLNRAKYIIDHIEEPVRR